MKLYLLFSLFLSFLYVYAYNTSSFFIFGNFPKKYFWRHNSARVFVCVCMHAWICMNMHRCMHTYASIHNWIVSLNATPWGLNFCTGISIIFTAHLLFCDNNDNNHEVNEPKSILRFYTCTWVYVCMDICVCERF